MTKFEELVGKTIVDIQGNKYSEELIFTTSDGKRYKMYHSQNCCESVYIEDIIGDLDDLLNSPITMAEESYSNENPPESNYSPESFTWTFYKFATIKGYVTIRWYGTSNGYYSESADFVDITNGNRNW